MKVLDKNGLPLLVAENLHESTSLEKQFKEYSDEKKYSHLKRMYFSEPHNVYIDLGETVKAYG